VEASWFDYAITFVLYCLVGITDYFDGYLARAQGTVSRLGHVPRSDRRTRSWSAR
jgi:phosphatidylglycerophosphate synthase